QLVSRCPLGTKSAPADGALRVALDVDDLAVADADDLATADGTVGADARHFPGVGDLEGADFGLRRAQVGAERQQAAERGTAARGRPQEVAPVDDVRHGSISPVGGGLEGRRAGKRDEVVGTAYLQLVSVTRMRCQWKEKAAPDAPVGSARNRETLAGWSKW